MKLYKIHRPEYISEDGDFNFSKLTEFAGSQADARKCRLNLEEPLKPIKSKYRPKVEVTEVDVPTDKKGLIEFLNELMAGGL